MRSDQFAPDLRLKGRYVDLRPLSVDDAPELLRAAASPEVQRYLRHRPGTTLEDARAYVQGYDSAVAAGQSVMFAIRLETSGWLVGATGYHHIDTANESVEVGGTWLDSAYWRTPINSDCKRVLFTHAFEEGLAHRVSLQTDLRNERSQNAILDLGATREAALRENVLLADGWFRTSVQFGVLRSEWAKVRAKLDARLARPWSPSPTGSATAARVSNDAGLPRSRPVEPPPPLRFRHAGVLRGRWIELVPLERRHIAGLARAGRDPQVWQWLRIGPGRNEAEMTALVEMLLAQQERGEVLPFVIRSLTEDRVVGMCRYLDIERADRSAEIGTWIDSALWRTPINTEAKYLLLRHAFEAEHAHRMELRTDSRNERSQRAIERLGARREGVLREHLKLPSGIYRSSVCYSILASEWPGVRRDLEQKLDRPWPGHPPP